MKIIGDQIFFKLLFFGTALAGKTTSLQWIYNHVIPDEMKGTSNLKSVNTSFGQTMLFDFVPIKVSDNINFRCFTTTGQDYYASTRRLLFQDVDGIFFVIDSQKEELEHNKEFVKELLKHKKHFKLDQKNVTIVVLFNKQDLHNIYDQTTLAQELKLDKYSIFETSALHGTNLKEAFLYMIEACLQKLVHEIN